MQTKNEILQNAEQRQPVLVQHFQNVIKHRELAHAYLFAGPSGSGKVELAMWIAMRLFCINVKDGQPCGVCEECQRITAREHPDVVIVEPDGNAIKVDQVRFLKAEFSKSGVEGNRKVFIVAGTETMTASAANSLLKFLEEPAGDMTALLLTTNAQLVLPTVISRTQVIEMKPLSEAELRAQFKAVGLPADLTELTLRLTSDPNEVADWLIDDWLQQAVAAVWQWFSLVAKPDLNAFVLVSTTLVPLAKDRPHQRLLLDMMLSGFRDLLMTKVAIKKFTPRFTKHDKELVTLASQYNETNLLEITDLGLQSKQLLERNVSFQNIAESLTLQVVDRLTEAIT